MPEGTARRGRTEPSPRDAGCRTLSTEQGASRTRSHGAAENAVGWGRPLQQTAGDQASCSLCPSAFSFLPFLVAIVLLATLSLSALSYFLVCRRQRKQSGECRPPGGAAAHGAREPWDLPTWDKGLLGLFSQLLPSGVAPTRLQSDPQLSGGWFGAQPVGRQVGVVAGPRSVDVPGSLLPF